MSALLPPATIGIIGGGQLGMMTVREAQRMGYRTVVWDPDPGCPASRLADDTIVAPFDDPHAATILIDNSDIVTYEFENVDSAAVERVEQSTTVYPGSRILKIAQHRRKEKEELHTRGFPVVKHAVATKPDELSAAVSTVQLPVVVKTTTAGYDGKGQAVLRTQGEMETFLKEHINGTREFIVEQFVELAFELSCIAVRSNTGEVVAYPISENTHRNNILHKTFVPARVSEALLKQALELGTSIIESFGMVGVLCVEMFVTKGGALLVNELAPRPHNSGHYSLDATTCSQFEALVRAVCGLTVPEPRLLAPCAMVNLLGKHLERVKVPELVRMPGVKLHLYGKKRIEPNRKMGHVTVLGKTPVEVDQLVKQVEYMIGE
ncbi:MAG TPA: 5-(carboxyamino)imidazole ribonucleotide synthase [Bacteroidota bacterium]